MLKIKGSKIALTRGDSAYITLAINNLDGTPYIRQPEDEIRVQVRTQPNYGMLLFEGEIFEHNDELIWHIRPEDTCHAQIGDYFWDAQIKLPNGDIFTFIPASLFRLSDEVTFDNCR